MADGSVITNSTDIKIEAARHFREFLQQEDADFIDVPPEYLTDLLAYRCTPDQNAHLTLPVTNEETRKTLFSLPSGKASGPDVLLRNFTWLLGA